MVVNATTVLFVGRLLQKLLIPFVKYLLTNLYKTLNSLLLLILVILLDVSGEPILLGDRVENASVRAMGECRI